MLSIGNNIPLTAFQGINNKKKNTSKPQNQALTSIKPSGNIPTGNGSGIKILETMALTNLIYNPKISQDIKQPAFESMAAQINSKMNNQQGNISKLSSDVSKTQNKLSKIESLLSGNQDISEDEREIYKLISSSLQAELTAFESLLDKAKNAISQLSYLASYGINEVVKSSDESPNLLEMLSRSNSEFTGDANTKLLQMSGSSADATKKMGGLIQSGKVSLKKVAQQSKKENPEKTAEGLDNLYRNVNLSKADKLTTTQVLSNIAIENPVNGAGKASANALENIFKKDSGAVALNAAIGLRMAAIAGNEHATDALTNVATSKTAGAAKNQTAILELTKVAKAGSSQSQRATESLASMVSDSKSAGKNRELLLDCLSEIANTGGTNGETALNKMAEVASNDRDPQQKNAFNNITKLNNHKILGNSQVVKAFSSVAESLRTDPKTQKQSTQKLGEAVSFGGADSMNIAEKSLTNIATNPANKAAPEAKNQLFKFGMNNMSKQNQKTINPFISPKEKQDHNLHTRKNQKNSNPFTTSTFNSEEFFKAKVSFA